MMKWWGWGKADFSFPMQDKPNLWPWIRKTLGIESDSAYLPVSRQTITLAPPRLDTDFMANLQNRFGENQYSTSEDERILHTYGKSYPDLVRIRRGEIKRAPDLVFFPECHGDVEFLIETAHDLNVCVIAFGGGTNIVGGVEPLDLQKRMIVSLDLRKMNRVISIDDYSLTATIEAGALGPKLESDLQARGFSLGHYPDSFEFSTLGGWLATRSAGMQSDAYGKIEDMVVALRLVTPRGTLSTRITPASAAGPDLNRMALGSEGTLGVITEATMKIHRTPAVKDYRGFLFRTFEDGIHAIHETLGQGFIPSMIRLQDAGETELAINLKSPKKGFGAWFQRQVKKYLKYAGYAKPCILLIGFEGDEKVIAPVRQGSLAILKKYGAFSLGKGVGKTWSADKFNVPYLRDFIMDYACMVDVAETATTWSNLLPLYRNSIAAIKSQFAKDGLPGYVGCHISHTYSTGASLYFTYAARQKIGRELEQYYGYKKIITDTFLKSGGTLTHHHAVGYEHKAWMEEEVSRAGIATLHALKNHLDPKAILNPGKLLPELKPAQNSSVGLPNERGTGIYSA
jgi:alkyldihydroxyacetonephosphate synthase